MDGEEVGESWRSHSCTSNTVGLDDDDEDEGGSGVDDSWRSRSCTSNTGGLAGMGWDGAEEECGEDSDDG